MGEYIATNEVSMPLSSTQNLLANESPYHFLLALRSSPHKPTNHLQPPIDPAHKKVAPYPLTMAATDILKAIFLS
jgi:hypothetical protein